MNSRKTKSKIVLGGKKIAKLFPYEQEGFQTKSGTQKCNHALGAWAHRLCFFLNTCEYLVMLKAFKFLACVLCAQNSLHVMQST